MRLLTYALALVLAVACSKSDLDLPVDPDRSHREEVRSDCRSWLLSRVRDPERIESLSRLDPEELPDLARLEIRLRALGIEASLSSLRWRAIAERREEVPLTEAAVVEEFITAAKELSDRE